MKQVYLILIILIIVPSMLLAYLAQRSLKDQELVFLQQQQVLLQGVVDSLATQVVDDLIELQRDFGLQIDAMLAETDMNTVSSSFDRILGEVWAPADVGFAVSLQGEMKCPSLATLDPVAHQFVEENSRFFCSTTAAEVYLMSTKGAMKGVKPNTQLISKNIHPKRKVDPEHAPIGKGELSELTVTESAFSDIVGESQEGILSRFLDNQLNVMVWRRLPQDPNLVLGAKLNLDSVKSTLKSNLRIPPDLEGRIVAAILDDNAQPIASLPEMKDHAWERPFVATEIGDALPHWETAVYLLNPSAPTEFARSVRWMMGGLLCMLLISILVGSVFVIKATRRRMELAKQQTDFVSNVSHELKTPLTSIKMFSEMLAEGRVSSPENQTRYLKIITGETNRLTRLINNVLDFSKQKKGKERFHFVRCDLTELVDETLKNLRPGLEEKGFSVQVVGLDEPCWIQGDEDALSQVLVNIISNAEKYSDQIKHISIELIARDEKTRLIVKDRGMGISPGDEEKMFEQFYRAESSMKKGIQGSGLGLTLSRDIIEAHTGRLWARNRTDGGCAFTIELPVFLG